MKIICFNNSIHSVHQPISRIFEFPNSQSTLLISIGITRTCFISNLFKIFYVIIIIIIISTIIIIIIIINII